MVGLHVALHHVVHVAEKAVIYVMEVRTQGRIQLSSACAEAEAEAEAEGCCNNLVSIYVSTLHSWNSF